MAKEKRAVKVRAMINLKYDKDVIRIGQEFLVRKSDIEEIKDYVEVLEKTNNEEDGNEKDNGEEDGNEKDNGEEDKEGE